ncbi:MAG: phosphoenolpyruvate--protein phosphotransferase [Alphaproteobacteria bacterium]|nr:phosphoenolpyruvate--protein phosphotransferase [Alphaproteobacteria bacterium]
MADTLNWVGSRQLLRRLRDVMAGGGDAQARLDQIVGIIARDMVAEVCSIYLLRPGDILELFATEGLLKTAVHRTRLRVGEGLVGDVAAHARPLSLDEAQDHPQFAYRPETGEEIYHSFLGVPILRGGRVRGVLVVQNQSRRNYTEEEVETLQTVAMVLAELVASGALAAETEFASADGIALKPLRLEGVRLNGGLAMGRAVVHERRTAISQVVAEDVGAELARFDAAVQDMHRSLDTMLEELGGHRSGKEHVEVLEAYRMFAEDRGWLARIREGIRSGLTADASVARALNDTRARMAQIADPYIRERILDLDDLAYRLLQHLDEGNGQQDRRRLREAGDTVLVARSLGPAELLDYGRRELKAVVLEEGSATAHVAIVARALEIPLIGRIAGLLDRVEAGDHILVDGDNGVVVVRPGDDARQSFAETMQSHIELQEVYTALRDLPPMSRDGVEVSLNLNAGLLLDLPQLRQTNAAGIGLYRTEIMFMMQGALPGVDEQAGVYRRVMDQADGRPVVFRTLDAGGDKLLPYMHGQHEENPAMGWRAIRMTLDRPFMLRQQLRALIRAAAGRPLAVMFPMVAEVSEYQAARAVLDLELARAAARGESLPESVAAGCMLEVPSLLFQLPQLAECTDFLAVGSNDLLQFLYASDRGNIAVSGRYDILSTASLRMLRTVVEACDAATVPVSVCGEMAGQPLEAMALVGLGFRSLSMASSSIGSTRTMIRSLDVASLSDFLDSHLSGPSYSLRSKLCAYARDHGVSPWT